MGFGSGISRDSIMDSVLTGRYTTLKYDIKVITGQYTMSKIASTHLAFYSVRDYIRFTYLDRTILMKQGLQRNIIKLLLGMIFGLDPV